MTLYEPDVALTDGALALLAAYLCVRLARLPRRGELATLGAVLLGGLASAALWGAVFHGFFPAGEGSAGGALAWLAVAVSIVVVAGAVLELGLRILTRRAWPTARRAVVVAYALAFAAAVVLVDASFTMIVRFYGPALLLALLACTWEAIRTRDREWSLVAGGFALSVAAAFLQQARVAIHPVYFGHNAVYHLVQAAAVVLLYGGFRRVHD